ncbi:Short-chain-enoyl-CoA hydratase (plasmid) [Burkholderia sp. AD24]|nr:Short-chain-enoyl-CoA hydratase [Burkholderia sp. AD24]
MSTTSPVDYEQNAGIAQLTLSRSEVLNAVSPEVLLDLSEHLERIRTDATIKAVIITGAGGRAFSAGADIRYLNQASPLAVREFAGMAVRVTNQIETLGKPVIAALNGHTLGGGLEIAEACSIRIVVREAMLGHPEVKIGAVAGFGGTTRLARLVGRGRAAEMLLRGRVIGAEEALAIGLVHAVVEPAKLMEETHAFLADILAQSPVATRLTWEALHRGLDMPLEESARLGADYFGLVAASEDFRIGTEAFLRKESPKFVNR